MLKEVIDNQIFINISQFSKEELEKMIENERTREIIGISNKILR
jgi:hypothetical protein